MIDWNIQSRAHGCQACGRHFEDKQPYHTLLSDVKRELTRLDVCPACWQTQFSQGARERKGFISYWQGIYEAPPAAPPDPVQKETVESLLRKIIELNDPRYAAASYILAVMLERKRLLKVKEQIKREGQRFFVYEHPPTGDIFTIPDPNLQLDQLEQVQHDVADLLEHGLNPPTLPPGPAPAGGEAAPAEPPEAPAIAPETPPVSTDRPTDPGSAEASPGPAAGSP